LPSPLPEVGKFPAGPPGTADAVPASDNDNPAAPNTGRALLRRFCFEGCFVGGIGKLLSLLRPLFGATPLLTVPNLFGVHPTDISGIF
jgi:hypothetical protein